MKRGIHPLPRERRVFHESQLEPRPLPGGRAGAPPAKKTAPAHRHPRGADAAEPGGDAGVWGHLFLCGVAAAEPALRRLLCVRTAAVRGVLRLRGADLRVSGRRSQGLLRLCEKTVHRPLCAGPGAGGHGADRRGHRLGGVPGRVLPGPADGGDRRLRRRHRGDQL